MKHGNFSDIDYVRGEVGLPVKTVFILANSIKKSQRCVAGREVLEDSGGESYWGGWVRPVTDHDEGAISLTECRLQDRTIPVPYDVVQISTTSNEGNPTQPENWYIEKSFRWTKTGRWGRREAEQLVETPDNLWLEPRMRQDRVTPQYLTSCVNHQSLYLIKPQDFCFSVEGGRLRCTFTYLSHAHNFSMTDPIVSKKYFPNWPNIPSERVEPKQKDNLLICVSLTPEFKGHHYKIVATVLED